jgi:hypothetical protein
MKNISVFKYLGDIIKWRLTTKKYLGKTYFIQRKKRSIIAENFDSVYFEGIKYPFPKAYIQTLSKNPGKNGN